MSKYEQLENGQVQGDEKADGMEDILNLESLPKSVFETRTERLPVVAAAIEKINSIETDSFEKLYDLLPDELNQENTLIKNIEDMRRKVGDLSVSETEAVDV